MQWNIHLSPMAYRLWLDANDNQTITDENGAHPSDIDFTGLVAQWTDKSGRGVIATSSGLTYPPYDAAGMNGLATIVFNGGQFFDLSSTLVTSEETIFLVTRMFNNGDDRGPWLGNSTDGLGHGVPGSFFNDNDRYFIGTDVRLFELGNAVAPTSEIILTVIRDSDLVNVDENGTRVISNSEVRGTINLNTIGYFPFGNRTFEGEISEILVYDRALTESETNRIGSFLASKYDLATAYQAPVYACEGFEPTFDSPIELKGWSKRVIPVKIRLLDEDGLPVDDQTIFGEPPVINISYSAVETSMANDSIGLVLPPGYSGKGTAFRYDPRSAHWVFNLSTRPYVATGTYTVSVLPGDTSYVISPTCAGQFVRVNRLRGAFRRRFCSHW